jgi:predicted O-methyltransferase YrrM
MATTPVMPIVPPYTPELLPEVVKTLDQKIKDVGDTCKVLELGSGWSTIWFARLGCDILSVEHDVNWFLEVTKTLRRLELDAHVLRVDPYKMSDVVVSVSPDYDIILVDCIDEQRIPCLKHARFRIRDNGWIVVDDTHWDEMKPIWEIMSGWKSTVIKGMHTRKTGEVKEHETTIFYR